MNAVQLAGFDGIASLRLVDIEPSRPITKESGRGIRRCRMLPDIPRSRRRKRRGLELART